jgi:hypothetical protein
VVTFGGSLAAHLQDLVAAKAAQQKRKAIAKEQEKANKKQKETFKF